MASVPGQRGSQLLHLLNSPPVHSPQSFHGQGKEDNALVSAGLRSFVDLPPHCLVKGTASKLVKRIQLVPQDRAGFGLGVLPFFAERLNPRKDLIQVPKLEVNRKALADFMGMTRMAVSNNAGNLPAALAVALESDKNPTNVLPPMRTPWSGVLVAAVTALPPPAPERGV